MKASIEHAAAGLSSVAQAVLNLPGAIPSAQLANFEGFAVESFTMTLGNQPVSGYLARVGFADGDAVEVAGVMHGERFEAMAVKKAAERVLWLRPLFSMGSRALKENERARIVKFCVGTNILALTAIPAAALWMATGVQSRGTIFTGVLAACVLTDVAFVFLLRTPKRLDFSAEVDAIGRAFEIESPEQLDFERSQNLARAAGKPYISGAKYY